MHYTYNYMIIAKLTYTTIIRCHWILLIDVENSLTKKSYSACTLHNYFVP